MKNFLIIMLIVLMPTIAQAEVCFSDAEALNIESTYTELDTCNEDLAEIEPIKDELKSSKEQLAKCQDRGFFTNIGWMGGILLTALALAL